MSKIKAIINGNILTMTGKEYTEGTILIQGEKIKSVGKNLKVPKDAEVIDAEGRLVLPGFVDAHSHLGMWDESLGFEGSDGNEITDPWTPQLRAIDSIYTLDPPFADAVKGGVTTVVTGPGSANPIGGQFAAIKTHGVCVDDMIVKAPAAMKCALGENPKRCYGQKGLAPQTRMQTASFIRETLKSTEDYMKRKEAAKKYSERPVYNPKYEAMIPVLKKELPLKVHCHRADDIMTAIRIAKEFQIPMTLDHCTDGHLIVDEIVKSGLPAIVGPSFGFKTKPELKHKTFETAAVLSAAGVKIAIMTDHPVHDEYSLPLFAGMAVEAGMTREDALKAITVNAAEIAGIADKVGTIAPKKDADIVIWDKDPLSLGGKTRLVMVNGQVVHRA